jgi:hypothetical protein
MDMSDAMDVTAEESRKRQANLRQREEEKRQQILRAIARHNGSEPGVVPFAAAAAAASRSRSPPAPPAPPAPPPPPAPPARFERSRSPPGSGNNYTGPKVPNVAVRFERSRSPKIKDEKKNIKLEIKKEDTEDKKDIKLETKIKDEKGNIKLTGTAPKMTTGRTRASSADGVTTGKVNINRNTDLNFWKQASANELRNAIMQRSRANRKDLEVKNKAQLIIMIRNMIRDGTW